MTAVGGPIDRAAAGWLGELCSVVIYMGHHSNFGPMGSESAPTGLGARVKSQSGPRDQPEITCLDS